MKERAESLLKSFTEAHSAPGYEDEVREIFLKEIRDWGHCAADKSGSVWCQLPHTDGTPRVMIAGHMDEVGFRVQNILPDGFIQFVNVGGWWTHNLLAQRVELKTRTGEKILGVVCSKPPHFLPAEQRKHVMPIEALCIDVGAQSRSDAEMNFGIQLGDPIVPVSEFTQMARRDLYMAKAFDNRVGMAGAVQAGEALMKREKPGNTVLIAGSVQEELGLRGAKTLAFAAKPDVAIVLEGPPADDTPGMHPAESQGRLGGGVQIRMQDPSAVMNPRLVQLAIDLAQSKGIPHQVTVRRSGGTDAGSFHLANEGIPSIVLGTPARYIHSHNAVIDINDYLAMVELTAVLADALDEETVKGLTSFL